MLQFRSRGSLHRQQIHEECRLSTDLEIISRLTVEEGCLLLGPPKYACLLFSFFESLHPPCRPGTLASSEKRGKVVGYDTVNQVTRVLFASAFFSKETIDIWITWIVFSSIFLCDSILLIWGFTNRKSKETRGLTLYFIFLRVVPVCPYLFFCSYSSHPFSFQLFILISPWHLKVFHSSKVHLLIDTVK